MTDIAVFVDGPLKGTTMPVGAHARTFGMRWQYVPESADRAALFPGGGFAVTDFETAHYRFRDVPMFGHTVLVGSVAQPPDSEACFEVLLSDLAKSAA